MSRQTLEQQKSEIIIKPKISYKELTTKYVENLSPFEAEEVAIGLLAERARVLHEGIILSWSEFNENPDLLINKLLARIAINKINITNFSRIEPDQLAVMSIENSASYFAIASAQELATVLGLTRPPRIIRARKLPRGESPSPAMSEKKLFAEVNPITANGESRTLVASIPENSMEMQKINFLVVTDDFAGTLSTLKGGTLLGINLAKSAGVSEKDLTIQPISALGKPDQKTFEVVNDSSSALILPVITSLNVRFWANHETGQAFIQANGFPPHLMHNANAQDFLPQK